MIVASRPAPALRSFIRYYYGARDRLPERQVLQPVPARSPQIVEFMFGDLYRVRHLSKDDERAVYPVALVGAQTYPRSELTLHGTVDAFTMTFQPGGLQALFSLPANQLTDADCDGADAAGRTLRELHERLGAVHAFADRVRVADQYLIAKRPDFESASGLVRAARHILQSDGCARVADLAGKCGLGVRQFERRFRQDVGVSPKLYARIVRFESALRRKAQQPASNWTGIAHALGYHDQMHMVHDFNSLAGDSPSRISGQLDMFVLPEVACAEPASAGER
jgi:AraC-like DNA-binding protein